MQAGWGTLGQSRMLFRPIRLVPSARRGVVLDQDVGHGSPFFCVLRMAELT